MEKKCSFLALIQTSSVGGGGGGGLEPPIGLWSMQNRTFLLLFRPIFGEKLKTAPEGNWVPKLWCRCRDSVWKSVWISDFGLKIRLNFGVDLFFFWRPLVFGLKNCLNFRFWPKNQTQFRWRPFFFFWRPPVFFPRNSVSNFGQTMWNWFKNNENSGWIPLHFSHSFKKAPPPPFPNPGYAPDPNI